MDEKIISLVPRENRDDAGILLGIGREISKIKDEATRENLKGAWRQAAFTLFSCPFSGD